MSLQLTILVPSVLNYLQHAFCAQMLGTVKSNAAGLPSIQLGTRIPDISRSCVAFGMARAEITLSQFPTTILVLY